MEKKTPAPEPDRVALQWLLAGGLMAAGLLAFDLPAWVSGVFAVCVSWRYAIERLRVFRPGRLLRYALAALVTLGVYREFGSILGRDPGLALLLALLGLKLLELRTVRDATVTLFLFYVVLLGGFLFGQTLPTALWSLATVAVTLAALIRLQQALPARAALGLASELLLKAIPLMVILYVLFPRIGGTLWGLPADARSGISGLPDEVRAGSIFDLTLSSDIAMRVDFLDGALPPARERYWRALVLSDTDGRTWRRDNAATASARVRALGPAVRYRVTLEPNSKRWLSALDIPVTTPEDAFMRPGFTLVHAEPVRERISYTVTSYPLYATEPLTMAERRRALVLPPVSSRLREFADQLRANHPDPAARVRAVLDYIRRENFVYTLAPPPLNDGPGDDPVDQFFFDTRRGFCEHYASAFATIMRAAGVPARVVIGYQGGELNPTGNYLIVRQSDAHAWNEVELPGRGWVRVDPTAAVAPERIELGIEAIRRLEAQGLVPGTESADVLARALDVPWVEQALRRARGYWDYTNLAWYRFVIDYRRESQENFLHALGFETIEWGRVLLILGGGCAAVLLVYVAWSRRRPPIDPAQRLYRRFCHQLARVGVERAPSEGPLAFADRASAARPDLAAVIGEVTACYLRVRYGRRPGNDELHQLARAVAALTAG